MKIENTFNLSPEHTSMLNSMDEDTKKALKKAVNTFGYYTSISFFMTELAMTEDKAKILADIGCYMLEDHE